MPLTELIRYFNAADHDADSTLYSDGKRVAAWHRGLKLSSLFRPVVRLTDNRIVGHAATIHVVEESGRTVDRKTAYARQECGTAIVHFDRLCRTLHALNFLAQYDRVGGYLQMAVHPRHLLAVPGQHGLVYEAILKRCGLAPEDIVLSVDPGNHTAAPHLQAALNNYRRRGYRLALTASDDPIQLKTAIGLQPDVLRVTPQRAVTVGPAATAAGITLETTYIESRQDMETARAAGVALGSGRLFGESQADCLSTRTPPPPAFHASFPMGARHEHRQ